MVLELVWPFPLLGMIPVGRSILCASASQSVSRWIWFSSPSCSCYVVRCPSYIGVPWVCSATNGTLQDYTHDMTWHDMKVIYLRNIAEFKHIFDDDESNANITYTLDRTLLVPFSNMAASEQQKENKVFKLCYGKWWMTSSDAWCILSTADSGKMQASDKSLRHDLNRFSRLYIECQNQDEYQGI